jgi:hypothetical protein
MTQERYRTWRFALLSVALVSSSTAWAATEQVHVAGSIKLHLHSDHVQPNGGSTAPVDVWVVDLQRLSNDLRSLNITATPDSPQILAAVTKFMQDQVAQRLKDTTHLTIAPDAIFTPPPNVKSSLLLAFPEISLTDQSPCDGSVDPLPTPPAGPQCRVVDFEVCVTPVKTITIKLASADKTHPLPTFAGTLKSKAGDSSIRFSINLSADDVQRDASGKPDFTEALRVVDQVREILDEVGAGIGAPAGDGNPFGLLSHFPTELLTKPFEAEMSPSDKVTGLAAERPRAPGNDLTVVLTGAKFPHEVLFREEEGAGAHPEALAVVEKHHLETFRRRLRHDIVRSVGIGRAVYELETDPYVKDVHFKYDNNSLVFIVQTKTVPMGVKFSGGAGYKPETSGYGSFGAALDNLGARGDSVNTKINFGPNIADVSLTATIPESPQPFPAGFHFLGLSAAGEYHFNDKAHYQVAGADLTKDQRKMLTGNVKLGLDSFSLRDHTAFRDGSIPHRKRIQHLLTFTPSYEIGLLTTTDRKTRQTLADGQITAFSAQPTYLLDWDLLSGTCSCGLSELRLQLDSTLTKGARWLGGDFAYDAAAATGTFELTFGLREPHQYLIRGRAGAGSASRGTPLPRLFQIGGPDYVRGLERGEFTANTLLWQQAEGGPSLTTLLGWIQALRPSHRQPPPCTDTSSARLPFDLRSSYLEVFYDHARVSQGTSWVNVLDQSTSLQGYGAALELGKVKNTIGLSLGYGYSPQSTLHRHGVMFVGVTLKMI